MIIFGLMIMGCSHKPDMHTAKDIIKIIDFKLSPSESKIAFSAITPIGNLDIWVVDLDGKNLKKLTFQDRSPTNRIAKFFKRYRWRNFFEIDMLYPKWTSYERVAFCQQLSKTDMWSTCTVSRRYWTINFDGTDKKPQTDLDKIIQREQPTPVSKSKFSDQSEKYKVKILLKNDDLLILKDGETSFKRLIQ
ncbi:MAG: hypothetical protein NTV71_01440 [Candidatus Omnitrophica bacterium]|nr:hypothetical protein [Candidatus Omnitrophota bacterium]